MYVNCIYHIIHYQLVSSTVATIIRAVYKITRSANRQLKCTHCYKAHLKLPT